MAEWNALCVVQCLFSHETWSLWLGPTIILCDALPSLFNDQIPGFEPNFYGGSEQSVQTHSLHGPSVFTSNTQGCPQWCLDYRSSAVYTWPEMHYVTVSMIASGNPTVADYLKTAEILSHWKRQKAIFHIVLIAVHCVAAKRQGKC